MYTKWPINDYKKYIRKMKFKEFNSIKADFEIIEDWEDRYAYIIDLGREIPDFDTSFKSESNKVNGCASQVWLKLSSEEKGGSQNLIFKGDSDAMIVKGLIAVIGSIYDGLPLSDIQKVNPFDKFKELDLLSHLSSQRSNGLRSIIQKIHEYN